MADPEDSAREKRLISVVSPAYNEEDNIDELVRRLRLVFDEHPEYDFEAIIVENGSRDGTWERIRAAVTQDRRFRGVQLARNFMTDGGITAGSVTQPDD